MLEQRSYTFILDESGSMREQDGGGQSRWQVVQSLNSGNHIVQWVVKIERKPCSGPADCSAGQTCGSQSQCVPL